MKIVQVHSLFSLPVHIPNRGADGLAKRAVFGGIERQRISYQAQQYALRQSPYLKRLENAAGVGHSYRTALVGERLLKPALNKSGLTDELAAVWTEAVMALWRKEKDDSTERNSDEDASAAPLIVGEQEIRLFVATVKACVAAGIAPSDLRQLLDKKLPKDTPQAVVEAITAMRETRGSVGLDGALFGRMATGVAVANVDRAMRISDALTTHAITPVVDFFLVTDDLKDRAAGEAGGSHINTREAAAGLFYRHVVIDTDQLQRNGVDPAAVLEPLLLALLTVSPIGNRSPARVVEALVEVGAQVRSLMDAYASPVAAPDQAVSRLRDMAAADAEMFGSPAASLWLSEAPPAGTDPSAKKCGSKVEWLAYTTLTAWQA